MKISNGCLILFGLPFLIGGLVTFIAGLAMLTDAIRAVSWEKTPANIMELNIKSSAGDSYIVEALYEYTYNGKKYRGTRFSFDKDNDKRNFQKLIGQVNSRMPPYCFVKPDNPSESVLLRSLPRYVNLVIPLGMCFVLVGGGLLGGSIQSSLYNRKAADIFKQTGKIPIDKITSVSCLVVVPLVTSFVLPFINYSLVSPMFGPVNTFLFTLSIMILSFYAGWKWSGRYTNAELEILTPPGRDREFKISLQFQENKTERKRDTAVFTNMSLTAALEVYFYDYEDVGEVDNSKKILLSVPFKEGEVYEGGRYFFIDTGSIKAADIKHPDDFVPFRNKFVGRIIKRTRRYKYYVKTFEIAGKITAALQGGPDAGDAAAEVYNALDSDGSDKQVHVDIQITGDMNLTFRLPPGVWAISR